MKKIAILTSTEAANASQLYEFFAGGNRLSIDLLLSDNNTPRALSAHVTEVVFPAETWNIDPTPIINLLKESQIDLLVIDTFNTALAPALAAQWQDKTVTLVDDDVTANARAVVAELEKVVLPTPPPIPAEYANPTATPTAGDQTETDNAWRSQLTLETEPETAVDVEIHNPQPQVTPQPQANSQQQPAAPMQPSATQTAQTTPDGHLWHPEQKCPNSYLVWSILSILLCCTPLGIVALVFSLQVNSKYFAGDIEGARRASERAQLWIILSIVIGIVFNALYLPLMLLIQ